MNIQLLCEKAMETMGNAYVPYSHYQVGAALLATDGTVFTGCNIENASYTPTVCAERTAFFEAVKNGKRQFEAIAVCGGKEGKIEGGFPPCGVCRQVMSEFCEPHFKIFVITSKNPLTYEEYTLSDLLPRAFGPKFLQ